jgi:hypothetical protein
LACLLGGWTSLLSSLLGQHMAALAFFTAVVSLREAKT